MLALQETEQSPGESFEAAGGAARVVRRDSDAGGVVEKAWPTVGTLISKLEGGGRIALAPAPSLSMTRHTALNGDSS